MSGSLVASADAIMPSSDSPARLSGMSRRCSATGQPSQFPSPIRRRLSRRKKPWPAPVIFPRLSTNRSSARVFPPTDWLASSRIESTEPSGAARMDTGRQRRRHVRIRARLPRKWYDPELRRSSTRALGQRKDAARPMINQRMKRALERFQRLVDFFRRLNAEFV
jgi:hypothetical protein